MPADKGPSQALKERDEDMFPNIHVLIKNACTFPVTSYECKRSASALRRLNNYMRATMRSVGVLSNHYSIVHF